jgi:hypothetical protein
MSERGSQILAGLEVGLLCLPLTALFLFAGLPSVFYFLVQGPDGTIISSAIACVVILTALFCAWRLLLSFIFGGRSALRAIPAGWWSVPYATAGLSLLAPIFVAVTETPSGFGMFGWGLPLLLPLVHLHIERKPCA